MAVAAAAAVMVVVVVLVVALAVVVLVVALAAADRAMVMVAATIVLDDGTVWCLLLYFCILIWKSPTCLFRFCRLPMFFFWWFHLRVAVF